MAKNVKLSEEAVDIGGRKEEHMTTVAEIVAEHAEASGLSFTDAANDLIVTAARRMRAIDKDAAKRRAEREAKVSELLSGLNRGDEIVVGRKVKVNATFDSVVGDKVLAMVDGSPKLYSFSSISMAGDEEE